jgi:hypothetical protein
MIRSVACPLISASLAWFVALLPASAQGFVGPYAASNWTVTGMQPSFTNISTRIEPGGTFILANCPSNEGFWFGGTIPSNTPVSFNYRIRGYANGLRDIGGVIWTSTDGPNLMERTFMPYVEVSGQFDLSGTYSFTMPAPQFRFGLQIGVGGLSSSNVEFATLEITGFNPGFAGGVALNTLSPAQGTLPAQPSPNELVHRYSGTTTLNTLSLRSSTASVVAPCSGTASFSYIYSGVHAGTVGNTAFLEAYSELSCGTVTIPLVDVDAGVVASFNFSGNVAALPIEAGRRFGVRAGGFVLGANNTNMSGTVRLSNFSACVPTLVVPTSPCPGDADGSRSVNFLDITNVLANFGTVCP